jgi:hypothetical protein
MRHSTKLELIRDGRVIHSETVTKSDMPQVEVGDTTGIADFSKLQTKPADACIYCGSTAQLSREHILAYALGGTTTILRGSCEECRKITHKFETAVLRGPMRMVRYIQGMPSGTKHKDVPETIPVKANINGSEVTIDAPRKQAPILLPFPLFNLPGYLPPVRTELTLVGVVTGNFGADLQEFGKRYGAQVLELKVTGHDAVAFARLVAKTAYVSAYGLGQLHRLKDRSELVMAMMQQPDTIGRFVGTIPAPYKKYPGLQHRISIDVMPENRLLFSTVQLFASAGAPSYIVVLGTLNDDDPHLCRSKAHS